MKNKVVIINQTSGFLVVDDLNVYCKKYDEIHLICGTITPGVRKLNPNVVVKHICKYDKSSSFNRMKTWIIGSLQIFFKLLFLYRGWTVIYYSNPPMACFSSFLLPNEFRIVEYDIYPDALQTIGINKGNYFYDLWARMKKKLYQRVDKIFTLSEGMKDVLMQYSSSEKINVVPLWSASEDFRPISKEDNTFIRANRLEGKFIVLYSGNIGYTHSVEVIVEVAKVMKDENDVQFLIIGEGKKKPELQKEVNDFNLSNVLFLPYQDFSVLPFSLASADLGVVTLDENVAKVSVPSKTFNLLAVGAPLLVIASSETEMYRLVNKYQNGRCIPKSDINDIANYIKDLKNNPEMKSHYSENSIKASKDFTYLNAEMYIN